MYQRRKRVNRQYKDRLFRLIFQDKESRLALYNAVNGTHYTNVDDLEIEELSNAFFMKMKNDVSFVFQFQLNIYEQQSTVNPNMPLRSLFYTSELLQRLVDDYELYTTRKIRIPEPRFIVFYNGSAKFPEQGEYLLTDMFEKPSDDPQIELRVKVININPGKNPAILNNCASLDGYSIFVGKVRDYIQRGTEPEDAVSRATDECINEGIMAEFFRKHRSEVRKMVLYEYDEQRHMELERKYAREDGREEGRKEGREENMLANIRALAKTMNLTADQAMDALQIPDADRGNLLKQLADSNEE